jgi:hypothetical protein
MSWLQTLRVAVWGERAETALERKVIRGLGVEQRTDPSACPEIGLLHSHLLLCLVLLQLPR